jgi:acetyltransferase-like isoleucine patch superfamily enzyme
MKPYFLVAYNFLRLGWRRIRSRGNFRAGTVELLGWNTKISAHPTGRVSLGGHLVSDGRMVIMVGERAQLTVGGNVYFNEGAMLSCMERVEIGTGCRFGPNVKVFDNDHKFDAEGGVSAALATAPVQIGNNCWLGANVVVLRGTVIGDNCVIGAGCVVKGQIPSGSVVTMNRTLNIRPIRKEK